jgi:hypothetical protein
VRVALGKITSTGFVIIAAALIQTLIHFEGVHYPVPDETCDYRKAHDSGEEAYYYHGPSLEVAINVHVASGLVPHDARRADEACVDPVCCPSV